MSSPRMNSGFASSKYHGDMSDSLSAMMLADDGTRPDSAGAGSGPGKEHAFPRTLSTSVLRIKHRSTFWERFFENQRRLA